MKLFSKIDCVKLIVLILMILSCSAENKSEVIDMNACCKIPPLQECVDGAFIYVPNAFTPNGDGINDIFKPAYYQGIEEVNTFRILTLENELLYEIKNKDFSISQNANLGWNGQLLDGSIVDGVYKFELELTTISNEAFSFSGNVCSRVGLPRPCIELENHCMYATNHDGNGGFNHFLINNEIDCQ